MIAFVLALTLASAPITPDPDLTPGAVNPSITQANIATTICVPGYTAKAGVRNVSVATKKAVIAEYHYDVQSMGPAEIDHLVSLELGGSNVKENLWPQSYTSQPYNAHMKDALEDRLHSLVCKGKLTLRQAQGYISTDWVSAYKEYVEGK